MRFFLCFMLCLVAANIRGEERLSLETALDYAIMNNPSYQVVQRDVEIAKNDQSIALKGLLPTLALSSSYERDVDQHTNTYEHALKLTQPIFEGMENYNSWRTAKIKTEQAENTLVRELEGLVFKVRKAWYDLVQATLTEREMVLAYERGQDIIAIVERMLEEGKAHPTDLLTAELALAQSEKQWVDARAGVRDTMAALLYYMDLPSEMDVSIEAVLEERDIIYDRDALFALAEESRLDLRNAYLTEEIERLALQVSRATFLPSLDLELEYERSGDNFRADSDPSDRKAAVSLSWDLWKWGSRYDAYKTTRTKLEESQLKIHDKRLVITREVEAARTDFDAAQKKIDIFSPMRSKAEENYGLYKGMYEKKKASIQKLVGAQRALTSTQTEYIRSLASLEKSAAAIDYAVGNTVY